MPAVLLSSLLPDLANDPVRRQLPLQRLSLQVLLPLDEVPDEPAAALERHEAVEVQERQDLLGHVDEPWVSAFGPNFSFEKTDPYS